MAPLPCSPVSHSTASESQSFPTSEDSDQSLTTPRPGPADPAQRTEANLSRASLPTYSASPRSTDPIVSKISPPLNRAGLAEPTKPQPGSSPAQRALASTGPFDWQDRKRSITFGADTVPPRASRQSSYNSFLMTGARSPPVSPRIDPRRQRLMQGTEELAESSADENTAIVRRAGAGGPRQQGYGAMRGAPDHGEERDDDQSDGLEGVAEMPGRPRKRKSGGGLGPRGGTRNPGLQTGVEDRGEEREGWFRALLEKYGSVELENKGSVARDHLALERTFLAWLRTSLSFASIGIAVTQLFRLNTSLETSKPDKSHYADAYDKAARLRQVGKPLGATFLGISILILLLGFHRFFESQHYVIRGRFPASRVTIILVSFVALALIVASLIVIVTVAPSAFEKR